MCYRIETKRLGMREMRQEDLESLCKILQDPEVMYAYEGPFLDEEVQSWLDRQLDRYAKYGFGLWAVIEKDSGEMIGQCGLTMQPVNEDEVLEIGYLFQKAFWHQGYAIEAASACKEYAFHKLGATSVCSIIRDNNTASQNVAKRNGMVEVQRFVKHYKGMDMPHILFEVKKTDET